MLVVFLSPDCTVPHCTVPQVDSLHWGPCHATLSIYSVVPAVLLSADVRNHGAVRQITWEEHRLEVNGLVHRPTSFSMADLLKLPAIDVTCTLTCVGEGKGWAGAEGLLRQYWGRVRNSLNAGEKGYICDGSKMWG